MKKQEKGLILSMRRRRQRWKMRKRKPSFLSHQAEGKGVKGETEKEFGDDFILIRKFKLKKKNEFFINLIAKKKKKEEGRKRERNNTFLLLLAKTQCGKTRSHK